MSEEDALVPSILQSIKREEICQVAFGRYDLQLNWGDGGFSCTGQLEYKSSNGEITMWTEGNPFDAVPLLRLLKQTIETIEIGWTVFYECNFPMETG